MSFGNTVESGFKALLLDRAQCVTSVLEQILDSQGNIEPRLKEALQYTLVAPGKRIRSAMLLWCCEIIAGQANNDAKVAAAALEMVHTYSLVHDDLPAMDDDDMRRGRLTCHKAFDEATAVLTGDALLTLAFEVLADRISSPDLAVRLISQLARDAGAAGMIAGQMADLQAENAAGDEKLLEYIHMNKTAKMFRCAAAMGGICGGGSNNQIARLSEYGLKIGLGFQIADDILDVSASTEQLGKTAGKDQKAAKCTYPAVVGLEKARQKEINLAEDAVAALESFGDKAETLRCLAQALLERKR